MAQTIDAIHAPRSEDSLGWFQESANARSSSNDMGQPSVHFLAVAGDATQSSEREGVWVS